MTLQKAVVLVGGKGTRLYPLTKEMPKALIPVHGRPLLSHLFDLLKRHGIHNVYLCVGHMKEGIKNHFKDGSEYGMHVGYIEEDVPLGTAGPLRLGKNHLTETFVCSNGDELKDINLDEMYKQHKLSGAKVTIALREVGDPSQYGVARLEGTRILEFVEKPAREDAPSNLINSGLYIMEPSVVDMIPEGFCMLEKDIFPKLAEQGKLFSYIFSGKWFDTGTSRRYAEALCGWKDLDSQDRPFSSMDTSIFKAYDIRGLFPDQLQPDVMYAIGLAFVTHLAPREVLIGRDARPSSQLLFDALSAAIQSLGVNVVDIGECSTPLFSYAMGEGKFESGIMITASHNPAQFNGLKLCKKHGEPISGEDGLPQILDIIRSNAFATPTEKKGACQIMDFSEKYIQYLSEHIPVSNNSSSISVVVDYGNGMASTTFPIILSRNGLRAVHLYADIDCTFPNHEANPIKEENLQHLQESVRANNADIGLAFDGDGDRVGFVDEKGSFVSGDTITALIAQDLLQRNPGEKILYDVRSSLDIRECIERHGGIPLVAKAGHSLIKKRMIEENILFGGEKSGHYFFRSNRFCDNAELAALQVFSIMSRTGKKLSELVSSIKSRVSSPEINFEVEDKESALLHVERMFSPGAEQISHLDGLTIEHEYWRFNLRKSNTENLLRLNVEAATQDILDEKIEVIRRFLSSP